MNLIYTNLLQKDVSLNVIFAKESTTKKLNIEHRKKTYIPNILTFPTNNKEFPTEIYITPSVVKKNIQEGYTKDIIFLFIHGILHAKGHKHGSKMKKMEEQYYKKYIV